MLSSRPSPNSQAHHSASPLDKQGWSYTLEKMHAIVDERVHQESVVTTTERQNQGQEGRSHFNTREEIIRGVNLAITSHFPFFIHSIPHIFSSFIIVIAFRLLSIFHTIMNTSIYPCHIAFCATSSFHSHASLTSSHVMCSFCCYHIFSSSAKLVPLFSLESATFFQILYWV